MALKGSCRKRLPFRCSRKQTAGSKNWCGKHITYRSPAEVPKDLKCPFCKKGTLLPQKQYLRNSRAKQDVCHCTDLPFPHRRGTFAGCKYWEGEWTDERERIYNEVWMMDRGFYNKPT